MGDERKDEKFKNLAAQTLALIEPGTYGEALYNQLARLMVGCCVEVFVFREIDDKLCVWMTQRPANDPFWPGEWHIPGRIMRVGQTFQDIFRAVECEFGFPFKNKPVFRGIQNRPRWVRGHEIVLTYTAELVEYPTREGQLINVDGFDGLPVINIHTLVIPDVIEAVRTDHFFWKDYLVS